MKNEILNNDNILGCKSGNLSLLHLNIFDPFFKSMSNAYQRNFNTGLAKCVNKGQGSKILIALSGNAGSFKLLVG